MDPDEDAKIGAEASMGISARKNNMLSSPRRPSEIETSALVDVYSGEGSEDDAQAGAQESPIASGESDESDVSTVHTRKNFEANQPEEGKDGSSSTLLGKNDHDTLPTLLNNSPANPPSYRENLRTSFENNVSSHSGFSAGEIPLPDSATSSIISLEMSSAPYLDLSMAARSSLEQLNRLGNEHGSATSKTRSSNRMSFDNSVAAASSRRSNDSTAADRLSLPLSVASSNITGDLYHDPQSGPEVPLGGSLEVLQQQLNYASQPTRKKKKKNAILNYIAGPARTKKKPSRPTAPHVHITEPPQDVAPETEDYRAFIEELASHFPTFQNVATVETRHEWSSRLVFYDFLGDSEGSIRKYEPWPLEDDAEIPSFQDFKIVLTDTPDECAQRLILVEDLTPVMIDLLGATLQIPPHVFEEHLERSGYRGVVDRRDDATAWHTRPSAHGYSSITWYRPVLPLVPITPGFHAKIIGDNALPQVRCPIEDCEIHDLWFGTVANIWRHKLDLCTDPGVYYKNSQTRYPVGWEERATIWTREDEDCRFGMPFPS